jgi:F-type H+-transporting ATPase subunit epsilon
MADTLEFELVSPEKLLLSEQVTMVVVPGIEGNFGAMPGHAPLLSTVRPGVLEVYNGSTVTNRIFVAGGFAEVTAERCTVLAEVAVPMADITADTAQQRLQAAKDLLAEAETPAEKAAAESRVRTAEAMIEVLR